MGEYQGRPSAASSSLACSLLYRPLLCPRPGETGTGCPHPHAVSSGSFSQLDVRTRPLAGRPPWFMSDSLWCRVSASLWVSAALPQPDGSTLGSFRHGDHP